MHRHKCGYRTLSSTLVGGPSPNVPGCGFIWEHVRRDEGDPEKYVRHHVCPNCGIGPWFAIVTNPTDVLAALSPYPPRVAFGRIVRPADDNPAYMEMEELVEFAEYAVQEAKKQGYGYHGTIEIEVPRDADIREEVEKVLNDLIGDGILPARNMEVIAFDTENKTISGFTLERGRKRR